MSPNFPYAMSAGKYLEECIFSDDYWREVKILSLPHHLENNMFVKTSLTLDFRFDVFNWFLVS